MKEILVVEDELAISKVLKAYLTKAGFHVVLAYNGKEAIEAFSQSSPALVLLDIMLPEKDGWQVLKEIRQKSDCPVIMLSALGEVEHRLTGLNDGADDYITKPFVADEVIARIQSVLRRATHHRQDDTVKHFGSLTINYKSYTVMLNGVTLSLTPRDLSLLLFLGQHPNQVFTREQLIEKIWGMDYAGSDRAVDLSIKRLRQSLKNWPASEGEIKTMRGMGYQFYVEKTN